MAYTSATLALIAGTSAGNRLYRYTSTTDTLATIKASGYFSDSYAGLASNDQIIALGTDGQQLLLVVNTANVITVLEYGQGSSLVNVTGSTLTVTKAAHDGRIVTLNRAAGVAVTLPAAEGLGSTYNFIIGTTFTSPATIKVVGNDIMAGVAWMAQDSADTVVAWETAADTDTITFSGTDTGGYAGTRVRLIDIATDTWFVEVFGKATGTEATPFSATVT